MSLGGSVHDPTDPVGRLLFNVLAMVAEFEADLISMRTWEGMQVAMAKGHLRGKLPKLSSAQARHLFQLIDSGDYSVAEVAELFRVSRSTIYRTIHRVRPAPPDPERLFTHTLIRDRADHHPLASTRERAAGKPHCRSRALGRSSSATARATVRCTSRHRRNLGADRQCAATFFAHSAASRAHKPRCRCGSRQVGVRN